MRNCRNLFLLATLASTQAFAQTEGKIDCKYKVEPQRCFPYACVPSSSEADPDFVEAEAPGFCGPCRGDSMCAGAKCQVNGLCSLYDEPTAPQRIWPHFNLAIADLSVGLLDGRSGAKPIFGAGYMFQGAFRRTTPVLLPSGGYVTRDLPTYYWNASATLAFAGSAQNVLAELGVTRYAPRLPLAIVTLSLGAVYQRQGASIWNVSDATQNVDRLGPGVSVGFLQNVFVRVSYLAVVRGEANPTLLVSVLYMKDLFTELIPDRFQKFLPKGMRN